MPLKALQQQQGITVRLPSQMNMMCFCGTASCLVPCLQRSTRAPCSSAGAACML